MQNYQEQVFFHYILDNRIFLEKTKEEFFSSKILKDVFEIAKDHTIKYNNPPSVEQIWEIISIKGKSGEISEEVIKALYNSKEQLNNYDSQWLNDNVEAWIKVRNIDSVLRKSIAFMKTSNLTSDNASEMVEKIRHMLTTETSLDFSFNMGSDFFNAASHRQTRLERSPIGYKYLDLCMKGGTWSGSLIVFLGPPKGGKSMWLTNLAAKSVQMGDNTAYVTLELQEEIVNMRIGSNLLNVPLDDYEKITEDQDLLKTKLNNLKTASHLKPLGALHIKEFPSSTASANDITAYLLKTQEILGIKFKRVFIDYINIMRNWRNPNSENTYMKIKQIAEDLRAAAMQYGWSIISVTQVNRGALESSDLNVTDVSESAALLFTVDLLFGIITNAELKANNTYYLKCLANRVNGYENTRKKFSMDWKYARIEEDPESDIEDMDFIRNTIINPKINRRTMKNPNSLDLNSNHPDKNKITVEDPSIGGGINISGSGLF